VRPPHDRVGYGIRNPHESRPHDGICPNSERRNGGPIEAKELCTRNAEHRRQPHLASIWFSQSVAPHAAYTCYCVSLLSLNCVAISNLLSIESKSRRPRQKNAPRGPVDLKSVVWNNVGQLRGLIYPVSLALCGSVALHTQ
jgi:hypothetical protein